MHDTSDSPGKREAVFWRAPILLADKYQMRLERAQPQFDAKRVCPVPEASWKAHFNLTTRMLPFRLLVESAVVLDV